MREDTARPSCLIASKYSLRNEHSHLVLDDVAFVSSSWTILCASLVHPWPVDLIEDQSPSLIICSVRSQASVQSHEPLMLYLRLLWGRKNGRVQASLEMEGTLVQHS